VNRILRRMVDCGMITIDGRVTILQDLAGLRGRADY
jgi:hypothetical protein